jgi:hypothetical protein
MVLVANFAVQRNSDVAFHRNPAAAPQFLAAAVCVSPEGDGGMDRVAIFFLYRGW